MRALGIDPSLSSCGWAVHDGRKVIAAGSERCPAIRRSGVKGVDARYSGQVVSWMARLVGHAIEKYDVVGVAIEEPLPSVNRYHSGSQSNHSAAILIGAAACAAYERGVTVNAINQRTWRTGVGIPNPPRGLTSDGRTAHNKRQAVWRCQQEGYRPRNHDEAEAVLIALWQACQFGAAQGNDAAPLLSGTRK